MDIQLGAVAAVISLTALAMIIAFALGRWRG